MVEGILFRDGQIGRPGGHGATAGHGVASIDNKVYDDLFDTVRIYFAQSNIGLRKHNKLNDQRTFSSQGVS
jgi:hypothetical protein